MTNVNRPERILSVVVGTALTAIAFLGLRARRYSRLLLLPLGTGLVQRGATGTCQVYKALGINTAPGPFKVRSDHSITVPLPREELYRYLRDFGSFPSFMKNIRTIHLLRNDRAHWSASADGSSAIEWDTEVVDDVENERFAWHTIQPCPFRLDGEFYFTDAPDGHSTIVTSVIDYDIPAGPLGKAVMKIFGRYPERLNRENLIRLGKLAEAGQPLTIRKTTSVRRSA